MDLTSEYKEQIKEYIDIDDALKRVGGNMDLLKRLLKRFLEGNHIEPLEEALEKNDKDDASRLAHTLKGVAANLSLIKIRDISVDLEHHIKNDSSHSECMDELKKAFSSTVEYISEITG